MYVVLTQDISIENFDHKLVDLYAGETVYVDEETMTAWTDEVVFEIEASEYAVYH